MDYSAGNRGHTAEAEEGQGNHGGTFGQPERPQRPKRCDGTVQAPERVTDESSAIDLCEDEQGQNETKQVFLKAKVHVGVHLIGKTDVVFTQEGVYFALDLTPFGCMTSGTDTAFFDLKYASVTRFEVDKVRGRMALWSMAPLPSEADSALKEKYNPFIEADNPQSSILIEYGRDHKYSYHPSEKIVRLAHSSSSSLFSLLLDPPKLILASLFADWLECQTQKSRATPHTWFDRSP